MPFGDITCVRPIRVGTEHGGSTVRCNRCNGCRLRRKLAWTGRILLEASGHHYNRMLTLTYSDDTRPGCLDYAHVQAFLKVMRERLVQVNPDHKQRFFVAGEYGEESGHPHWHLIVFGQRSLQPDWMRQAVYVELPGWTDKWGFASDTQVNATTAAYVAGYVFKKGQNSSPFARMSLRPGIGFPAMDEHCRALYARMKQHPLNVPSSYSLDGKRYPIADGFRRRFIKTYEALGGVVVGRSDDELRQLAWDSAFEMKHRDFESLRWKQQQEKERVYGKALPSIRKKKL